MNNPGLLQQAEAVLRGNDLGHYTKPSPRLYPHQWNWDSAFIAIGWAHLDWSRATREIETLLAAQWTDGMVPHIRYNPAVTDYHPGPDWWRDTPVRREGVITSGISQPPVLPTAVYLVGMRQPDPGRRRAWWERLYEPLRQAVAYFPQHRTTGGSSLIAVIHPWESGLDNSPRWDFATRAGWHPTRPYRRVDTTIVERAHRPTQADYDMYMYLVEQIAASGYDMAVYLPRAPFLVYDALFNAIWYRAAVDLNRIADAVGRPPAISPDALRAFRDAYRTALWHEPSRLFRDFDVRAGVPIPVDTGAGLGAIYGGLVDAEQARAMVDHYRRRCAGCRMIPSVPPDEGGFDPERYWRGPVWVNLNWLVARGLEALGLRAEAQALAESTIALVRTAGFHEYYHPHTGAGLGGADFSWSAALVIDLLRRPVGGVEAE
ncbi:MAG: trehalase family glycosidase [Armatimonadota bacterium]|nr:trehalase family glycosidase [Armatimonadota bacterium]MDR7519530.1 trehalase family glycosidase [Armatimonadota bacterium]MDR7548909.1 trehalase family glycosidase [Armatimonadota bacterium]